MKNTILLFVILTCYNTLFSQEWTRLNGPFGKAGFENIVVQGDSVFISRYGEILLTDNNGNSWVNINYNIDKKFGLPLKLRVISDTLFMCTASNTLDKTQGNIFYMKLGEKQWKSIFEFESQGSYFDFVKNNDTYYVISTKYGVRKNTQLDGKWQETGKHKSRQVTYPEMIVFNDTLILGTKIQKDQFGNIIDEGILISTDNGENWEIKNNGLTNTSVYCLVKTNNQIYCGTENGLFVSNNFGDEWQEIDGFQGKKISKIASYKDKLIIIASDGVYSLFNNDIQKIEYFNKSNMALNLTVNGDEITFASYGKIAKTLDLISFDEFIFESSISITGMEYSDSTLYLATYKNGLYKHDLRTQKFEILNDSLYFNQASFQFSPYVKDSLILVTAYLGSGMVISKDSGKHFEYLNLELTSAMDKFFSLNSLEDKILIGATSDKFYSSDNGNSWKKIILEDSIVFAKFRAAEQIVPYKDDYIYCYDQSLIKYNIKTKECKFLLDTATFDKMHYLITCFKKYDDFCLFFSKSGGLNISYDEENWKRLDLPISGEVTSISRYKKNIFIKTNETIYLLDTDFKTIKDISYNLPNTKYGNIKLIYDKLYYYVSGIYTISLSDLGINYTSIKENKEECKNLKEIEFYDLLGNKLLPSQIFNKRILVKYQCLETGEYINKLEFREK